MVASLSNCCLVILSSFGCLTIPEAPANARSFQSLFFSGVVWPSNWLLSRLLVCSGCCPGFWFVPTVQPSIRVSSVGYLRLDASVPSGRGCFVALFGRPSLFSIANAVCLPLLLSRLAAIVLGHCSTTTVATTTLRLAVSATPIVIALVLPLSDQCSDRVLAAPRSLPTILATLVTLRLYIRPFYNPLIIASILLQFQLFCIHYHFPSSHIRDHRPCMMRSILCWGSGEMMHQSRPPTSTFRRQD